MKKIKFSFIVPAYNVEQYIVDCLASIHSQKGEYECLIIDDGSIDQTAELVKEFCESKENFFYFYKKNGGLSSARNFGLSRARGQYVIFVDSDDYISENLLGLVIKALSREEVDMVCYGHKEVGEQDILSDRCELADIRNIKRKELFILPNFACIRVIKRDFYVDNPFPEKVVYEDVVTSSIINWFSRNAAYIEAPLYFYRKRPGSITTGHAKNQFGLFSALKVLRDRVEEKNLPIIVFNSAFVGLAKSILVSLIRLVDDKDYDFYSKICIDEIKKIRIYDIIFSYSTIKNKAYLIFLKIPFFGINVLKRLRRLMRLLDKRAMV